MTARFVVVEGGDGSGKSTQIERLVTRLRALDVDVIETFEPGATPAGAVIRELLLHRRSRSSPTTEALLMAADRAQHVEQVIRPALDAGKWVVSDRYLPSSLVYQGVVRGLGVDAVDAMNQLAVRRPTPDLVLVLDVADDVVAARRGVPTDRLEAEGASFHADGAGGVPRASPVSGAGSWSTVTAPIDAVAERVWRAVEPLLAG